MDERSHKKTGKTAPNDAVFFQLFMGSQKSLYAYILASIHNYADANDILQETVTVMWRRFEEFDRDSSFIAWGISIARNQIRTYFNSRKCSRLQFDSDLAEVIETTTLSTLDDNEARMEGLAELLQSSQPVEPDHD